MAAWLTVATINQSKSEVEIKNKQVIITYKSLYVLGMWSCTVKLDEENPMYASLAQENGFGST
jgi:hypothetical protein